ncbi:MAG: response regulator [Acidobacteria bacterium]|nr:response regulator [Acidobacteriota bacterium]
MKVLLAVASSVERAAYKAYLESSAEPSYTIVEAENPEQLAALYDQFQPQCIVFDAAFAKLPEPKIMDRVTAATRRDQCGLVWLVPSEKINAIAGELKKGAHIFLCADHLDATQLQQAIQYAVAAAHPALPESVERYQAIVEALPEILFTALPNGRIDFINQQFYDYTGLKGGEYQDFGWFEALHPEDVENVSRGWREAVESGTTFNAEYRFRRADGHYRWFRCRAVPLRDEAHHISKWFGICMDMTEQKRLEQERENLLLREMQARDLAEAANRAKDEFLAMVSHELRAPLNAVLGWINILRSQEIDEATFRHALETIERSAKSQATLIEDLVDSAMIATGKMRIKMERVNLVAVVQAALDVVVPAAEAKAISINFKVTANHTQVLGDASRLQQVMWNLLSNAVKFTPEGGSIEVIIQNSDGNAQITVSDSGRGITAEMLPFVFERFQQADVARTKRFGGLGLGLSLVKQLVELHGGVVQASSAGDGKGATFIVNLPLRARPSGVLSVSMLKALSQVEERGNRTLSFNGLRVLVVDDDADAREISAIVLRQQGAKVMQADSAREAFRLLTASAQEAKPDILISDIGMPEEDGYSLIRRIRALPPEQGGQIPAIALTAFTSAEDRRRALETGFQVHLAKPIEPNELIKVIGTLANRGDVR